MPAARVTAQMLVTGSLAGLAACAGGTEGPARATDYLGAEVKPLTDELVQLRLSMRGGADAAAVEAYARCVAAGYAVKNKAGFVRQIRTVSGKEGGIWRADAVYSVTLALPEGMQTIDAEVTVEDCAAQGIPTA